MKNCEMLHCCGFFKKYKSSLNIDCRGFVQTYCKGQRMSECARLEYFRKYDDIPSDDMLPSGKMIECGDKTNPYSEESNRYF